MSVANLRRLQSCQLPECGKDSPFRCSKCKHTRYCSVNCQKRDYPSHRKICPRIQTTIVMVQGLNSEQLDEVRYQNNRQSRIEMFEFKQKMIKDRFGDNPPKREDIPFLSFNRQYWSEKESKEGCDDEPPEDAVVTLRGARDSVDDCVGFWPIAPHPDKYKYIPYEYDENNYIHENATLTKEEHRLWCLEAEKEEPLCRVPPKGYTPLARAIHTVTISR